ncbi:TspO/MBR family protein [Georgenia sp. M64]|uniref:TspO/MBR family protein n=1 Tax=Georgenia sp. M64 TaxID=3120520 RepID=UPI0030E2D6D8
MSAPVAAVVTRADRVRQVAVTISLVLCVVGSMIGVGVFGGTPIQDAAGGLLAADATHLAPASPAFSVWTVIYLGLGAYTVVQLLPGRAADSLFRKVGWPAAASMLLNAAWILVVQAGLVALSVAVIVALLAVLVLIFLRLGVAHGRRRLDRVVVDGTFGAYLGWVSVATVANIAAALLGAGFTGAGLPQVLSVAMLAVVAVVGVGLALVGGAGRMSAVGRYGVAATMVWGLVWIGVGRTQGEPLAPVTAYAAWAAAAVIAAVTLLRSRRRTS